MSVFLHNLELQGQHPTAANRVPTVREPRAVRRRSGQAGSSPSPRSDRRCRTSPQSAAVFVTRASSAPTSTACSSWRGSRCWRPTSRSSGSPSVARRARSGRWPPSRCLPVAAVAGRRRRRHDAFTTAITLLVVSSALRALDPPPGTSTRALVVEALAARARARHVQAGRTSSWPGCYLLPLLGAPAPHGPVAARAARRCSACWCRWLWNQAVGDLWKTDAGYFGVKVDDAVQRHELLHRAVGLRRRPRCARGTTRGWDWLHTLVDGRAERHPRPGDPGGDRASSIYAAVVDAARPRRGARAPRLAPAGASSSWSCWSGFVLRRRRRSTCTGPSPASSQIGGIQPRYFVPLLALVPVADRLAAVPVGPRDRATVPGRGPARPGARWCSACRHVPHVLTGTDRPSRDR